MQVSGEINVQAKYKVEGVVHLAAESHVDRSISDPTEFIFTNIIGTVNLLNACKEQWKENYTGKLFYHISTDEVYGSLEPKDPAFSETTTYAPNSPYAASKAACDHLVRAHAHTYGLPVTISNCSNNYGPYQFPEKLIPLFISNAMNDQPLPVYGKGENVRDWIHVLDHCRGIDAALRDGKTGEVYNFGGETELQNIVLTRTLLELLDKPESLIQYVRDRPGHDLRYAIDCTKAKTELGWSPQVDFRTGLQETIEPGVDRGVEQGQKRSAAVEVLRQRFDLTRAEGKPRPDESDHVTGREIPGNAAGNFGCRVRP